MNKCFLIFENVIGLKFSSTFCVIWLVQESPPLDKGILIINKSSPYSLYSVQCAIVYRYTIFVGQRF